MTEIVNPFAEYRPLDEFPKYEINRWGEVRNIRTGVVQTLKTDSGQYYLLRKLRKYRKRSARNLIDSAFPENARARRKAEEEIK